MAKKKKKPFGIKTTRYFTKTCIKCKFEYPNWFTNCPRCGTAWDESETEESGELKRKTIKIVVKITEEDFHNDLNSVKLIFSADNGKSWYQMNMENKLDYFIAEIVEVPIDSLIIYYIEVLLGSGKKIIENNEGKYYIYKVGSSLKEKEEKKANQEEKFIKKEQRHEPEIIQEKKEVLERKPKTSEKLVKYIFDRKKPISQKSAVVKKSNIGEPIKSLEKELDLKDFQIETVKPPEKPITYKVENSVTIFGKPQTQVDPELKICPNCSSKIKKMWSICPICGKPI